MRIHTLKGRDKTGMAMCLALHHHNDALTLIAAFENGYVTVQRLESDGQWTTMYHSQAHSQPVLSLSVYQDYFITSSADSIVAKHPIPSDLFFPIESTEAQGDNERVIEMIEDESKAPTSLLSAALKGSPSPAQPRKGVPWRDPLKTINTKHSGQQSLSIRSDGKIFATAGWDSKVRVYSAKTMKELAVLKWHQVGCYAVAFADVTSISEEAEQKKVQGPDGSESRDRGSSTLSRRPGSLIPTGLSVKDQRIATARRTHWIAAGAKDGKISLWDIY